MATNWNLINNDEETTKARGNYNTIQYHHPQMRLKEHQEQQFEDDVLDGNDFIDFDIEQHTYPQRASICSIPTEMETRSGYSSNASSCSSSVIGAADTTTTTTSSNSYNNNNNNNYNNITNNHDIHHTRHRLQLSASLPIEVPTRRTRRDTSSMKLSIMMMMMEEEENSAASGDQSDRSLASTTSNSDVDDAEDEELSPVRKGDRNRPAFESLPAFDDKDDDDSFLDQEFNANHHNHYSVDDLDDENLSAEADPMRLFASIQALAKSLHEDSELFGSLPPKRLLESPIRSIAFV